jgi:thiol:disulfide interchange protein DsbD
MKNIFIIITTVLVSFCYSFAEESYDGLVKAEIYSNVEQIQRGGSFYVVIKLNIADDWHVYWKNPGDSGLPTEVKWETPEGVEKDGNLIWQVPEKIKWSGMINYGFSHNLYLVQKFKTTRVSDAQNIEIKADVNWLVCKEKCIPQDTSLSIDLQVADMFGKSDQEKLVNELLASAPRFYETKSSVFEVDDDGLDIDLMDLPKDLETVVDIYPITSGIVDNTKTPKIELDENEISADFALSPYLDEMPTTFEVLVLYKDNAGTLKSYETSIGEDK